MATRYNITSTVQRIVSGNLTPGNACSVSVTNTTGTPITVYAAESGAGTLTNPITTSSFGRIEGWVATPDYNLIVSGTGITTYTEYWRQSVLTGSIVNADVSASAAIAESKLNLASDAAAGTASRRSLGTTATKAAAGNDARFSDNRTPTDASVTMAKLASDVIDALGGTVPAGTLLQTARATAATGYLMCDGAAVSRTTYAALFAAIGTAYGAGNGSTTFNVPDARGRTAVGKGTHGDVDSLSDNDGVTLASRRPYHSHTVASHNHGYSDNTGSSGSHQHSFTTGNEIGHTQFANGLVLINTQGIAHWHTGTTDAAGAHTHTINGNTQNTAPGTDAQGTSYFVVNYMIKT